MYGVLVVAMPTGEQRVLKAFSGLLNGQGVVPGWMPPIPGREQVAWAEAQTLRELETLKQELIALQQLPERAAQAQLRATYHARLQALAAEHRRRKAERDRCRRAAQATLTGPDLARALAALNRASQQDGIAKRNLKRERDAALEPLRSAIAAADTQTQHLKQQRKTLSRQLQHQMHAVYSLTNFAGHATTLSDLLPGGLPTGTGDCAAPKLLHYAASQGLQPLGMAEFWWGPAVGDKQPGQFYGACHDRCQPIMGFLLSGLSPSSVGGRATQPLQPLKILYQDEALLVVEKPSGLLSVPGRGSHKQDSLLSRLRQQLPELSGLQTVHRLDQDTSGLLVLAITSAAHAHLSHQFADRQVCKTYEAILSRPITAESGVIALPLWGEPCDRPRQSVNQEQGKPSRTEFQRITLGPNPRVRFIPHTGRTHQLRVHAAHPLGLNAPILGDRLYGGGQVESDRLHLHAAALQFTHPVQQKPLCFTSPVPF